MLSSLWKKTKKREKTKKNGPEDVTGDIGDICRLNLLTCLYNSEVFVREIGISDASMSDLIEARVKTRARTKDTGAVSFVWRVARYVFRGASRKRG